MAYWGLLRLAPRPARQWVLRALSPAGRLWLSRRVFRVGWQRRAAAPGAVFPEEMNRQVTAVLADYHFAPTNLTRDNLLREGRSPDRVFVAGNSAIDLPPNAVRIVEPLDTIAFHNLLGRAHLVLTDSGGIQEEAPIPTATATPESKSWT